jgi:hypothetical protein
MTMAAVDEADFNLWLDALSDTLEIREMAIQRDGFNGGSKADKAERGLSKDQRKAERIAAIRSAIVYGGPLMIKNTKESMFKSSWKERYFVIASGAHRTLLGWEKLIYISPYDLLICVPLGDIFT